MADSHEKIGYPDCLSAKIDSCQDYLLAKTYDSGSKF